MKKSLLFAIIAITGLIAQAQLTDIGNSTFFMGKPVTSSIDTNCRFDTLNSYGYGNFSTIDDTNITIDGQWTWTISYSGQNTHITGYRITNNTNNKTSGTLRLKLFFTNDLYSGGSISGWVMFDNTLGQLGPNQYFYNIVLWPNWVNPSSPGNYYSTLTLLEYNNGTYYIIDYLNFPNQISYNTAGVEDLLNNNSPAISQILNSNSILIKILQSMNPNLSLEVFNLSGKIVHNEQLNDYSNKIDLSFLHDGVYIANVNNNKYLVAKQKIILSK